MLRVIGGVLAASAAAPYLAVFFILLLNTLQGDAAWLKEPLDLLKFLVIGTFGLVLFGLPVFVAAAVVALTLNEFGVRSRTAIIISGATLGWALLSVIFAGATGILRPTASLLAGGICGWIYWRIAIQPLSTVEPWRS